MNINFLLNRCKFAYPKKYEANNEIILATIACVLWFIAIIVKLNLYDSRKWSLAAQILEALSFVIFGGIPVFFLATPQGAKFCQKYLLKNNGIIFQLLICTALSAYIFLVKLLGLTSYNFIWLNHMESLIIKEQFWFNALLFILSVFVVTRIPFMMLKMRDRTIQLQTFRDIPLILKSNLELSILLLIAFLYMVFSHTSFSTNYKSPHLEGYFIGGGYFILFVLRHLPQVQKSTFNKLTIFDLLLTLSCLYNIYWFARPFLRFGAFMGASLFIVVIIYGIGLEREHFGYSFQINKKDFRYIIRLIPLVILFLIPFSLGLRFVNFSLFARNIDLLKIMVYWMLFSFIVAIFEKLFFRSALMTFVRDQIKNIKKYNFNSRQIVLISAVICSLVFGISHIGNNPGAGISLNALDYKLVYAFLATTEYEYYGT